MYTLHWICGSVDKGKHFLGIDRSWIAGMDLKLAQHKTDELLISSRKSVEIIIIILKQAIKYMGVVIDNRLASREYLMYIGCKCVAT